MKKIIAGFKIFFSVIYTVSVYSLYFFGLMSLMLFGVHYEPWRNFIMKIWAKGMARIFFLNVNIIGTPPQPPFFLVSNHLSYIDIVVLNSILKTTFIAKSEVKKWPVIGFMAKTMGVIFIDRTKKRDIKRVNKIVSSQLNNRQGVILFPEGMTSSGKEILPFRASLLEHPASEKIDVSYAAIYYSTSQTDEPAYKSVCWWGPQPFYKHIMHVASNKKICATIHFGERTITNSNRKVLAKKLHEEVKSIFVPMFSENGGYQFENSVTG